MIMMMLRTRPCSYRNLVIWRRKNTNRVFLPFAGGRLWAETNKNSRPARYITFGCAPTYWTRAASQNLRNHWSTGCWEESEKKQHMAIPLGFGTFESPLKISNYLFVEGHQRAMRNNNINSFHSLISCEYQTKKFLGIHEANTNSHGVERKTCRSPLSHFSHFRVFSSLVCFFFFFFNFIIKIVSKNVHF